MTDLGPTLVVNPLCLAAVGLVCELAPGIRVERHPSHWRVDGTDLRVEIVEVSPDGTHVALTGPDLWRVTINDRPGEIDVIPRRVYDGHGDPRWLPARVAFRYAGPPPLPGEQMTWLGRRVDVGHRTGGTLERQDPSTRLGPIQLSRA